MTAEAGQTSTNISIVNNKLNKRIASIVDNTSVNITNDFDRISVSVTDSAPAISISESPLHQADLSALLPAQISSRYSAKSRATTNETTSKVCSFPSLESPPAKCFPTFRGRHQLCQARLLWYFVDLKVVITVMKSLFQFTESCVLSA